MKNADGTKTTMPLGDLNDRSAFNPLTDFVLNPAAWQDPAQGQYSTSTGFYNDYRYPRHPEEKLSIGRVFQLREGMSLSIRADFDNMLNRYVLSDSLLTSTNATATPTWNHVQVQPHPALDATTRFPPTRSAVAYSRPFSVLVVSLTNRASPLLSLPRQAAARPIISEIRGRRRRAIGISMAYRLNWQCRSSLSWRNRTLFP